MPTSSSRCLHIAMLLLTVLFMGCGGSGENSSQQSGQLSLFFSDSPGGYKAVYVTIKEIQVHKNGGPWESLCTVERTFDLLGLRNGVRTPLGLRDLPAGEYTQLRLLLSENPNKEKNLLGHEHPYANYLILNDNTTQELKVPSTLKSGIKLFGDFSVHADKTHVLTLDFDLANSIVEAGKSGQWLLKPVIKIIPEAVFEKKVILSGTVTENSGGVLEGVKVALQKKTGEEIEVEAVSFSDAEGNYHFHAQANDYILVAYKEGYLPFVRDLNLTRESTLNISLDQARETGTLTLKAISGTIEGSARISLRKDSEQFSYELISIYISSGFNEILRIPQGAYKSHADYNGHRQSQEITIGNGDNLEWVTVF